MKQLNVIITHKPLKWLPDFCTPANNFIILNCGNSEVSSINNVKVYNDTDGINIHHLNPFINEMTGIYWLYNNYKLFNFEYITFSHYRRFFNYEEIYTNPEKYNLQFAATPDTKYRSGYAWLDLALHVFNYNNTLAAVNDTTRKMLLAFPYTRQIFCNSVQSMFYCKNMFFMNKFDFMNYYNYLFPAVITNVYNINTKSRIAGYLAEIISSAFFNNLMEKYKLAGHNVYINCYDTDKDKII